VQIVDKFPFPFPFSSFSLVFPIKCNATQCDTHALNSVSVVDAQKSKKPRLLEGKSVQAYATATIHYSYSYNYNVKACVLEFLWDMRRWRDRGL